MEQTRVYENPRPGDHNAWTERVLKQPSPDIGMEALYRVMNSANGKTLKRSGPPAGRMVEALVLNPDAANMLRDGLRYIAMRSYIDTETFYDMLATTMPSTRQSEYYLRDGAFGLIPKSPSGTEAPQISRAFEGGVYINNERYAAVVSIIGDDVRFDRLGIINQIATQLGQAAKVTMDSRAFEVITDTSKYTRTKGAGDNDVGANTQDLNFTGDNFNTAYNVVRTSRDRTSGVPMVCMPDTLVCAPRVELAARQLLMSPSISRVGVSSNDELYGTGTENMFMGMISRIIVSPMFGENYEWAIFDSRKMGLVYQELEPFDVIQQTIMPNNEAWFTFDEIKYRVSMYFGLDFVDDRPWFYSNSSTAPSVS